MQSDDSDLNDSKTPNDILILGCCYTPEKNPKYNGPLMRYDEINQSLINSITGKNVYIEHELKTKDGTDRAPIGQVVDAYINSDGQLMSFLHISGDPIASSIIPHGLVKDENGKRYYNDLSLGHGVGYVYDEKNDHFNVVSKTPEEISIVRNGDRPNTRIQDYWLLPNSTSKQKIKEMIPNLIK